MPTWQQKMEMKGGDGSSSSDDDHFSQTSSDIPHKQSHLTINSAITSRENSVTDIVAVILASANRQEAPTSKFASNKSPNYNLLLADASLSIGKCARMVVSVTSSSLVSLLLGADANNNIEGVIDLGALQAGDVVRFNQVEVYRRHDDDSMSCSDNQPTDQTPPLLNIVCDLRTSWKIPHAGPSFARICRILPQSDVANTGQAFRLQWERNIPMNFETSRDIITELAIWYSRHYSKPDSVLCKNENQECKKRRIRDINTTNQVSHVLVKVLRCERATAIFSTPCKSSTESRLVHATLSDGPGTDDVIGLSASVRHERVAGAQQVLPKGISTTLLQAMIEGSYVLITNLTSQSINPVAAGKEYLGLQPTIETSASIITMNHPYFVPRLSQYGEDANASQPLTLERASQLLSLTQQIDSPEKKDTKGLIAIVSPLRDIFVDGISASLVEGCFWEKPRALSNFLIQSTGLSAIKLQPSYRSATLLLDHNIVSREIVVNADGNALKLLCLDVPIEDMIVDDLYDASKHPYLLHVGRVLQSLCEENVLIRWIVEQEDERNFFVINATLLEI